MANKIRVTKEAGERRNEILDAADELFREKGFDTASTNDILEKVRIARGTLYYHFKSKEDIMDALIDRYNDRILETARRIASDKSVGLTERLVRTVVSMDIGEGGSPIVEHIHRPQNALMHRKIEKAVISGVTPIINGIIEEGIEEGLFSTPFSYESTEWIVIYANTVFDEDMFPMTEDERLRRIRALGYNAERILGAAEGSLLSCIMRMFDKSGGNNE